MLKAQKVESILYYYILLSTSDISIILFKFDPSLPIETLLHNDVELVSFSIMHFDDGVSLFWREFVSLVPTITNCTVPSVADEIQ